MLSDKFLVLILLPASSVLAGTQKEGSFILISIDQISLVLTGRYEKLVILSTIISWKPFEIYKKPISKSLLIFLKYSDDLSMSISEIMTSPSVSKFYAIV